MEAIPIPRSNSNEDLDSLDGSIKGNRVDSIDGAPGFLGRPMGYRESITASTSGLNEVDGLSRKSSVAAVTGRLLSGSLGLGKGSRQTAVGAFLMSTLHVGVDNEGQSAMKDLPVPPNCKDSYQMWGDLLANWEDSLKRRKKTIRELVYEGIPDKVRCLAWLKLANAYDADVRAAYKELVNRESPFVKVIRRDMARTFPDHELFKEADGPGQGSLLNLMKVYSIYDREVGYCQGSPFIAGLLLMHMPEEEAFCVFVKIMHTYGMRDLFKPNMTALDVCLHLLDKLMQEHCPDLHEHFCDKGLAGTMYASSWFLTLFASVFHVEGAFRLMDLFLCEGMDAIFRVSLAILLDKREKLLKQDMPGMMTILQGEIRDCYGTREALDGLLRKACNLKVSHRKLMKQGKDYQQMREKDTEEAIENRKMRAENQKLTRKMADMEAEVQSMTAELIGCQMSHAELVADKTRLRNDLALARKRINGTVQRQKGRMDIKRPLASSQPAVDTVFFLEIREAQGAEAEMKKDDLIKRLTLADRLTTSLLNREAELEAEVAEVQHLKLNNAAAAEMVASLRRTVAELSNLVLDADQRLQLRLQEKEAEQQQAMRERSVSPQLILPQDALSVEAAEADCSEA